MKVYRVELNNRHLIHVRDSRNPFSYSLPAQGRINQKKKLSEELAEHIRGAEFVGKPSRLLCIFAFGDLETARRFRDSGRTEPNGVIVEYRVTRLDNMHKGDMDLYNAGCCIIGQWEKFKNIPPFQGLSSEEARDNLIRAYWQGKRYTSEKFMYELLISGRIEFERVVEGDFIVE